MTTRTVWTITSYRTSQKRSFKNSDRWDHSLVWNVRQYSVLYFGWRITFRSSFIPWENWHLSPYLHLPVSVKGRQSSVLYRVTHPCEAGIDAAVAAVVAVLRIGNGSNGVCCCCCCSRRSVSGTRGDEREEVDDPDEELESRLGMRMSIWKKTNSRSSSTTKNHCRTNTLQASVW